MARAILKFPGAKWRMADWIISLMPPHKSYLEPFFGSGAVFFCKPPSRIETINDLDYLTKFEGYTEEEAKELEAMAQAKEPELAPEE